MFTINTDKCIGCKACVDECPAYLIEMDGNRKAHFITGASQLCIRCGHCEAVCPTQAAIAHFDPSEMLPVRNLPDLPEVESMRSLLLTRRSIRTFKNKKVDVQLVKKLVDAARYSPTAKNSEKVRWILVDGKDKVDALAKLTLQALASDEHGKTLEMIYQSGRDVIMRGASQLVITACDSSSISPLVDSTIALTSFELLAIPYGIGTCWAGYFRGAAEVNTAIERFIGLEPPYKIYGALMVGYPRHRYHRIPLRKELDFKVV